MMKRLMMSMIVAGLALGCNTRVKVKTDPMQPMVFPVAMKEAPLDWWSQVTEDGSQGCSWLFSPVSQAEAGER